MNLTDNDVVKTCGVVCGDNRFELIKKFKKKLFEQTNIETAKDEAAVIDSVLFRFWQMGWLDKLEDYNRQKAEIERYKHSIKLLEKDVADAKSDIVKEFALKQIDELSAMVNEKPHTVTIEQLKKSLQEDLKVEFK